MTKKYDNTNDYRTFFNLQVSNSRAEANPIEGKISNDSPIAKGILGKKLNDEVVIQTPGGDMKVRITKIESV